MRVVSGHRKIFIDSINDDFNGDDEAVNKAYAASEGYERVHIGRKMKKAFQPAHEKISVDN